MNILFYIDRYPGFGGIERVSTIIIQELCNTYNIFVISNVQQEGIITPDVINLIKMPDSQNEKSSDNLSFLISVIKEKHIDAIVYQDSYGSTYINVCKAVDETKIPLYVFEHNSPLFIYNKLDLDPITSIKGILRHVLHPYLLHREKQRKRCLLYHSTKYVLLSKLFIPEFCRLVGTDEQDRRIIFINNPSISIPVDQTLEKENIILCVSRLAQEKCVDKMIRIWKDLSLHLDDWRFVIMGDGPERAKLEALVSDLNVSNVEFTGFGNPIVYYQKAKIFWMTSKFEGWGMTLVEAMQFGCVPVAYSTFTSIKDIIENGKNGYLISNDDASSFKRQSLILAENEQHWNEMSANCINKTEQYSLDKIKSDWINLLKNN